MKRSEMVSLLVQEFDQRHMLASWVDGSFVASEILHALEKVGIRPPMPSGDLAGIVEDGEWDFEQEKENK